MVIFFLMPIIWRQSSWPTTVVPSHCPNQCRFTPRDLEDNSVALENTWNSMEYHSQLKHFIIQLFNSIFYCINSTAQVTVLLSYDKRGTTLTWLVWLNSLAPGKFEWNFRYVIFKQILVIDGWGIAWEIALIWTSLDFTRDQSTLA